MTAEPPPASPRPRVWAPATLGIGFAAGLLNGLIGIGGGIVIVPGLMLRHKLDVRAAVATSLGAVMCLSTVAFAAHVLATGYRLDPLGSVLTVAAGMAGAQVGGWLLNRLPRRLVILVFAGVTLFTALRLLTQALGWGGAPVPAPGGPPVWAYPLFGAVAGLFSGLLGIGGGGYVVLGFAVFFDTPVAGGLPIALALNVTNALSGVLAQRGRGLIRWGHIARLVPAALVGILLGAALAVSLPAGLLRIIFAAFFLFMAGRLMRQVLRS